MSRIITFLGKAGTGHTTVAIATAKWFADRGSRVLFVTHNPSPKAAQLLGTVLTAQAQIIAPKLEAVQLQTTVLLEQSWTALKQFISALSLPAFDLTRDLSRRTDHFARI